eukprot:CAMPEP_0202950416 /NCGR_PEP_ID=MMETSP1395-20130829/22311_1 /ASSEMBLY_ACC=CAM_ASM_000871 /TAXON_ID=5961 /ORGANISM="Blepharisma japonicum, Strain Stock R1072" /LENGTH=118 /DNA_ID=CAMNT_0049654969 /DNA_START=62 /DNA_END=418 /DNA_ORIENTATION=+
MVAEDKALAEVDFEGNSLGEVSVGIAEEDIEAADIVEVGIEVAVEIVELDFEVVADIEEPAGIEELADIEAVGIEVAADIEEPAGTGLVDNSEDIEEVAAEDTAVQELAHLELLENNS